MPSRWPLWSFTTVMALLAGAYYVLPDPPRYLWTLIGGLSVAAVIIGVVRNRPRRRLPWWLVAAGLATFIAGDTVYDLLTEYLGQVNPFPSAADVLYLGTYPLLAGGLLVLVRTRAGEADRAALLDALILTVACGFPAWVILAEPLLSDPSLPVLAKVFSVAYPLGDLVLLGVLARLLTTAGVRSAPLLLLTLGTVGLLLADVLYMFIQLNGSWQTGGPVDAGWIAFYVAWGAAALHPDMAELTEPRRTEPRVTRRRRLVLLGMVTLIPVAVLLGAARRDGDVGHVDFALASGALSVLVSLRLAGLVRLAGRSAERERVLRCSGEALAAAASRADVHRVGAGAISSLAGHSERHRVLVMSVEGARLVLDHDSAATSPIRGTADLSLLLRRHAAELRSHQFALVESGPEPWALGELLPIGTPVLLVPLVRGDEIVALVAVSGGELDRVDIIDSVCATAAQMVLALESVALAREIQERNSEEHFRALVQNTSDIILVVDAVLVVTYLTTSLQTVLGHRAEDVRGRSVFGLVSPADVVRVASFLREVQTGPKPGSAHPRRTESDWELVDASGHPRAFEATCCDLLDDPLVEGLVLTLHETTERRALEDELKHLAFHDPLTQLPNRSLFLDRVEHALSRRGRGGERLVVLLLDLDDFKVVNDTRGHAVGDALLVAVGERLGEVLRPEDTCARLGGDEFAILVEGLAVASEAEELARRLLEALRRPYQVGSELLLSDASMGMTSSEDARNAEELMLQADLAMYAAKEAGKGGFQTYRPSLQDAMLSRHRKRLDLRRGLDEGQFVLHYQPVVDLGSGQVVGVEALLRWQHPERGLLMPDEFIAAVEEGELAVPLGCWVLETAVAQAAAWRRFTHDGAALLMNVNVTPHQLEDPAFVPAVARLLDGHVIRPESLVLEIIERTLATTSSRVADTIEQLAASGVGLAVDDFGTGYSSLGYLRRFPVTALKVDRFFTSGVDGSRGDRALVEAVVRLAETFGLGLVAEGVETVSQRDALIALGCRRGQGFLYSRALPADEAEAFIAARTVPASAVAKA